METGRTGHGIMFKSAEHQSAPKCDLTGMGPARGSGGGQLQFFLQDPLGSRIFPRPEHSGDQNRQCGGA